MSLGLNVLISSKDFVEKISYTGLRWYDNFMVSSAHLQYFKEEFYISDNHESRVIFSRYNVTELFYLLSL